MGLIISPDIIILLVSCVNVGRGLFQVKSIKKWKIPEYVADE